MRTNPDIQPNMTAYLLQFCYTCTDAAECTTEEDCRRCAEYYTGQNRMDEEIDETQWYLQQVHA
ncbi:hypothetical protein OIN60_18390 [Paenibacillus sp. P96]|uniref:Uncharacterized protein n=1 Tax=Paenibacillus zeirhizosphaerae TaxID=2987519 RepID=A0ABT9FVF0_9BACL|nr:hypothetical protein [Paenibacillus sp. P96]MDP4098704.1 hypothetical protein [Paenibacillus sp. P96]